MRFDLTKVAKSSSRSTVTGLTVAKMRGGVKSRQVQERREQISRVSCRLSDTNSSLSRLKFRQGIVTFCPSWNVAFGVLVVGS